MIRKKNNKVVLAYSGGLDTSAIIPWLKENYNFEVVAFVADIGQSKKDLNGIEKKSLESGASSCHVFDLKEEFIENYVYPVLKTGALYEGSYLLGTAMARPIIAKKQVELALNIGANSLCHGATGKGNDQVRFEMAYAALAPNLNVIAPWREWNLNSRESLLKYLDKKNISTTATLEKIYSKDENSWHISTEGGLLENPWNQSNEDCWSWTVNPEDAPEKPEYVSLQLKEGCVVSVNNQKLNPLKCVEELNSLGAKHGIGRIDIIENRLIGMKSRGCYETPGGTIIMTAIKAIEQLVLDRESFRWREKIGLEMSSIVYDGRWFSPIRKSLQAAADSLSLEITGEVILKLYKGSVTAVQKKSPNSLYSEEYATFGEDKVYKQSDADGFIRLFSLSSKIRAQNMLK
ncbi:argininosuccinate synthase [Buchnera aphidicola str. APS (Acyrthosiphon pisum)]|uniref:Argininosuccinate synthase n=3 Tax=Buchnera aphidicola TaxID=9 RepID=ASSY_BUCAI|nr:argininosuccinate synthase [Buchnera aphidicola]B8D6W2.1 RecName: Full=Argininosuccinate synthase; AltName: Full=Citrulline--aspartate ligase [Buchnera aphidicola str. Tuc7 (Acyrthosiphon pisum)]B8D8K8.1 RecName: Full=Argininosuccinate synthase; AltName: Full=Citrulline--aspartate ligase [Buchnera aphidicola str. 5A (Acyrthosiphon pisum)]P57158.1 RecName: Full=Argininosuccinate synthase; AltName: Full=Citrulline--aspartate ligase [Buchnera aphidicola str. APS (Acyrthosiphon pisum)]pir/E84935